MYTLVVLIALASLGQSPQPAPAKAEAGQGQWTPLFNGKDTAGFVDDFDNGSEWQVVNGVLQGRGGGSGKPAVLVSERQDFANYRLKVVFGCRSKPGFGCIEVRRSSPEDGVTRCYRVAAIAGPHGAAKEYPPGNIGKARDYRYGGHWAPARESAPVQAGVGRWHTLEVVASGDTVTTFVNGKEADRFTDKKGVYRTGGIALVVGGTECMQFKEVSIQELPAE
jgi:hypothetical protein